MRSTGRPPSSTLHYGPDPSPNPGPSPTRRGRGSRPGVRLCPDVPTGRDQGRASDDEDGPRTSSRHKQTPASDRDCSWGLTEDPGTQSVFLVVFPRPHRTGVGPLGSSTSVRAPSYPTTSSSTHLRVPPEAPLRPAPHPSHTLTSRVRTAPVLRVGL